ncbi:ABC transporter [Paucibacter sp. DJ1R-11]|uniref:ABC transporter ATP-binding protein n=1 Tax=Paucibacter sp. DJ1R-11 TaxID=2893556 RepID=UPI0021E48D6D|nr:ATP-binding cassette domain-containing protein [Paucibacter sp. DJ1R-11]MCV2365773.1 ABC transporter [Paucibacter sp. DJ1R-11]
MSATAPTFVFRAQALRLSHPDPNQPPLFDGLSFELRTGLSLLRGGDGRGKTRCLRLIAGQLGAPASGQIECSLALADIFFENPTDPALDAQLASAWLSGLRQHYAAWRADLEPALVDAFALVPHLDKPLYMLSAGSRRKLGLLAAAVCGARLTLLDTPFAALDGRSIRVLGELLQEAALQRERAWLLADYERPACLQAVDLMAEIDLGD